MKVWSLNTIKTMWQNEIFLIVSKSILFDNVYQKSSALEAWEKVKYTEEMSWHIQSTPKNGLNPFPHTTILQQTTLSIFCQKIENLYNLMDNLRLKLENIVAKGEIARFVQFIFWSLCFQKAVCCRKG